MALTEQEITNFGGEFRPKKRMDALDILLVVLSVLAILLVVFSLFFMTVKVRQTSMLPTLKEGDVLLVLKTKDIKRGDIVVYKGEESGGDLIVKRAVALPGDTLEIGEDGILRITYEDENGNRVSKAIKETYLNGENFPIEKITLKSDEVYLLGDNRAVSLDSRTFGAVPISGVVGKIIQFGEK